ncbi:hypothetical protein [Peribacillus sp. FSL R5-0717]|uniref:hypothetical protein n=1 Tax=Peribacillus sp. FSL R5-0717 TaxID=2975308 RepID=UPI0030F5E8B6
MVKYCHRCKDGQEYSDDVTECPVCETFLSTKRSKILSSPSQAGQVDIHSPSNPIQSVPTQATSSVQQQKKRSMDNNGVKLITKSFMKMGERMKNMNLPKIGLWRTVEGEVRNFHEDEVKTNFIKQWFISVITGAPFVRDGNINSFEVLDEDGNSFNVVLYGKMVRGRFQEYSRVKVFGSRGLHNTIVANSIKTLNSQSRVRTNFSIPATFIRLISLTVFFYMYQFILFLAEVNWANIISIIIQLIIIFLGLRWMIRKLFR